MTIRLAVALAIVHSMHTIAISDMRASVHEAGNRILATSLSSSFSNVLEVNMVALCDL